MTVIPTVIVRFLFLKHVHVFWCEISLVCCWKCSYICFSSHFCLLVIVLVCVVSGRCHQSFFAFFYLVFDSSYRCINAIFNVGESSSSFFSWHIFFLSISSLGCKSLMHRHEFSCSLIIIHSLELFISALADGFSLESEWQQVSSSLQDSSQYSGRSQ